MKLKMESISFRYDDRVIFNDFNLTFNNGLTFVIGNNNSGKSTLFNILCSKLPYQGNIYFNNINFKKKKDCMFLDEFYLSSIKGIVSKYLEGVDDKIIDFFDISNYLDKEISKLSRDVKVKLCLAKFMYLDFDLLFIDNMLCWLNKNDRVKILKKLKIIAKKKIIVIITNNMEDLIFANRIIYMKKGEVIIDEDKENFFLDKKKLEEYGVKLPFLVDLSYNLKLYNIVDDIYYDIRKLVDDIWK